MVIGIGAGAFITGWHLVKAQERLSRKVEQKLEELKREKQLLEEQITRLEEIIEKEKSEKEQLKEKIKELEYELETREEEITRLRLILAEKSQGAKGRRPRRTRLLE